MFLPLVDYYAQLVDYALNPVQLFFSNRRLIHSNEGKKQNIKLKKTAL